MSCTKWVATWGNATSFSEARPESYARDITLRYRIRSFFDGSALRLTFSNLTGREPVVLSGVTVGQSAKEDTAVLPDSLTPVLFGGRESAEIAPGGQLLSDPVAFPARRGQDFTVSIYLAGFTEMSAAVAISGPLVKNSFATGNHLYSEDLPLFARQSTGLYYFLNTVDVLTSESCRALIAYGDSITAQSWPDHLALRLLGGEDKHVSVIRRAVSGSRILRQYDCLSYRQYGLKGDTRFAREMETSGADTVVILHGINDTLHPDGVNPFRPMSDMPSAADLIEGMRGYIRTAHGLGLSVYAGTLLPIEGWRTYAPFRNDVRTAFNEWMRTSGEADGVVDFDAFMRDPKRPNALCPDYDSGDHLHPSSNGAVKMADLVFDALFKA